MKLLMKSQTDTPVALTSRLEPSMLLLNVGLWHGDCVSESSVYHGASIPHTYSTAHVLLLNKTFGLWRAKTPHNCTIFLLIPNNGSYPDPRGFIPYSIMLPDIDHARLINTIFMLKRCTFFLFFFFCQAASSFLFNISPASLCDSSHIWVEIGGTDLYNEISVAATTLQTSRNNRRHRAKVIQNRNSLGVYVLFH